MITGITGLRNRGVEALLATVVAGLRRRWPDSSIDVLTYDFQFDSQRDYPVRFHANPFREPNPNPAKAFLQSLHPRRRRAIRDARRLIAEASVVIPSGGDVFSSDYGSMNRHLMPLRIALQDRVPVFMLGHSIGRFKNELDVERWLEVARRASGITVRESATFDYVRNVLKLTSVPLVQTADTAFLLEPADARRVETLRREFGLDDSASTIACSVSQGITLFTAQDGERHAAAWADLIRHITTDPSRRVLIIPHVQERQANNDDRILVEQIRQRLQSVPGVVVAEGDLSAGDYKGLIAGCQLVIAERMHAAIAGFSSGVPTIAVGYSIKAEGIVSDVLGPEHAESGLMTLERFIEPGRAAAEFDKAWRKREQTAKRLQEHVGAVKTAAEANFEALERTIASR